MLFIKKGVVEMNKTEKILEATSIVCTISLVLFVISDSINAIISEHYSMCLFSIFCYILFLLTLIPNAIHSISTYLRNKRNLK